jgi:hypothetical protein
MQLRLEGHAAHLLRNNRGFEPNGDFSPTHFHSPPPPLEKSFSASPKAPEMIRKSAIPNGIV